MNRFTHNERGAAAVEFALVLPLLVLLVFGIVQFSIAYNRTQGLHAAAREGARYAALPSKTRGNIEDHVRDALDGVLNATDAENAAQSATVTVGSTPIVSDSARPCDTQPAGTAVKVTVSVPHRIDVPLWNAVTKTITGKGEFRCE